MAYIGQSIKNGTFAVLDTSGNTYNSSNTTFSLGTQVGSAAQLLVSKNGVIQKPGTDFTLGTGGTQIIFSTAPASSDSIFIVEISGAVGGTITPIDDSVTADKLNNNIISGQTALTLPPATTDEFLISDGGTIKRVDYSVIGNTPAFLVNLSGDQSLNSGTFTKITFDSEVYDTNSAFASNKFTVPTDLGGKYVLTAGTYLDNIDDTEYLELFFYKNGSSANFGRQVVFAPNTNRHGAFTSTITLSLNASDYIEIYVYHDEGSAQSARSAYTFFAGHRLAGV
jgi:hypothetical protein